MDQTFEDRAGEMFDSDGGPPPVPGPIADAMQVPTGITGDASAAIDSAGGGIMDDPRLKELQSQGEKLQADRRSAMDPKMKALEAEVAKPGPPAPQLEKTPPAPKQDIGKGAMEYLQIATVFGALAGVLARRGTTTSLNAFAGAIQGFTTGNLEMFKAKSAEWRQQADEVQANNQQKLDQYNLIWKDKKMNIDQKMEELKLVASQYGDEITYNLAEQRNYTALAQANAKEREVHEMNGKKFQVMDAQVKKYEAQVQDLAGSHTEAIQGMVQRRLSGDASADRAMGRSRSIMAEYQKALKEEMDKRGMTPEDLNKATQQYVGDTAQQRLRGGMSQRVEAATEEVERAIPLALSASRSLPRGQFVPINKLKQMGQKALSNPAWNSFLVYNQTLSKAYGRAMNPQGIPRVSEQMEAKADGFLDKAASPEAYEAQVRALWAEVQNSKAAIAQTREGLGPSMPFPGGGTGPSGGGSVIKYDAQGNRVQ